MKRKWVNRKIEEFKIQHREKKKDIEENLRDTEKKYLRSFYIGVTRIPVTYNSVHRKEEVFEIMAIKFIELRTVMRPHIKKIKKINSFTFLRNTIWWL